MENFFTRYRNLTVLLVLLMAQVIVLATQVRRPDTAAGESMSLMRFWVVQVFIPGEKALSSVGGGFGGLWRNYIDLRGMRAQNEELQAQVDRLRLEQVSLAEDAGQARRLQALLAFKSKFIAETVAAQVIGTSGSEHSHVLYIDKGSNDGIKTDMAVITPKGIIGKINKVFYGTSQVLQINDAGAGAGVMLERSRLRGVLRGTDLGIPQILHVMADEKIEIGEPVVSSGGDQIYPRGLPIGTVAETIPDPEGNGFVILRVKPSANLDKVEEVLVITKVVDKEPAGLQAAATLRAADILAQRLPTITPKAPEKMGAEPPPASALYAKKPASATLGTGAGPGASKTSAANGAAPAPKAPPARTAANNSQAGAAVAPDAPKTSQPKQAAPQERTAQPASAEPPAAQSTETPRRQESPQ